MFFLIYADHECLQQISNMGESKPRIQRWMNLLSAYSFCFSYRRGRDNANADFLSRLPLPPTEEDISGSPALSVPDDLGVYLIRACGYIVPSCPIPGISVGGLAPSSYPTPGTGLDRFAPSLVIQVLGRLRLTNDDLKTSDANTAYDRSHQLLFRGSYRNNLYLPRN